MYSILNICIYDSANHIIADIISSFWGLGPFSTLAITVGFSSLFGALEVNGLPRAVGLDVTNLLTLLRGLPFMMSALEGGGGSWKSRHSKRG